MCRGINHKNEMDMMSPNEWSVRNEASTLAHTQHKCTRLAHVVGSVGEVSDIGSGIRNDGRLDKRGGGVTRESL